MTSGKATMHAVSATATCAIVSKAEPPETPTCSSSGSINAADDDASSTAYNGACPVWNRCASNTARPTLIPPTATARRPPTRSAPRTRASRTGTCEPATNMTRANPMFARKAKVGSSGCSTPAPDAPRAMPTTSSPSSIGSDQRGISASSGPASATTPISASVAKLTDVSFHSRFLADSLQLSSARDEVS